MSHLTVQVTHYYHKDLQHHCKCSIIVGKLRDFHYSFWVLLMSLIYGAEIIIPLNWFSISWIYCSPCFSWELIESVTKHITSYRSAFHFIYNGSHKSLTHKSNELWTNHYMVSVLQMATHWVGEGICETIHTSEENNRNTILFLLRGCCKFSRRVYNACFQIMFT